MSSSKEECIECKQAEEESQTIPHQHAPAPPSTTEATTSTSTSPQEDASDPSTFVYPELTASGGPIITIEYCDKCRWAPRASWVATELFLTFPSPAISSITLMPSIENAGRFRIWMKIGKEGKETLLWDRKVEGGFPELKVLKQRLRDVIQPQKSLGHSDAHGKNEKAV